MRDRLAMVLQVASLALTGWFLWGARLAPHWRTLSVFDLAMVRWRMRWRPARRGRRSPWFCIFSARQWEGEEVLRATLRSSRVAIWFAPAVILFTALSPAAMAAAAVLVVSATRLLYHEWREAHPVLPAPPPPSGLFAGMQLPPPQVLARRRSRADGFVQPADRGGRAAACAGRCWPAMGFAMSLALGHWY